MTYAELQFMKAEAAFKKDKTTAFQAYQNGIKAHFDFINRSVFPRSNSVLYNSAPISTAERNAYLAGNNVKQSEATLTITDIMLQKYIALWGLGFYRNLGGYEAISLYRYRSGDKRTSI